MRNARVFAPKHDAGLPSVGEHTFEGSILFAMTNDEQEPEFDPSASVWGRRWMEFNPFVQIGSQLQFDTIGPLVRQFAEQPQLQFDTIGPLVRQFAEQPQLQFDTIGSLVRQFAEQPQLQFDTIGSLVRQFAEQPQLQFDTIGSLVRQFAEQPQLQFDTIGSLVKQFANPAWHETIHSAIQRLADAEAKDGQESAEVSRQALSSNDLSVYVVATYVWVCVFFWLYALRVENRGLDEFLQTTGLDPVTVATGAAGLCAKVCRRS